MKSLIYRSDRSWPAIRLPGKDSGSWKASYFFLLCFAVPDGYPRRINNALWNICSWPGIRWISTLWARGGAQRCRWCRRFIWPSNGHCCDHGNRLPPHLRYTCGFNNCRDYDIKVMWPELRHKEGEK